MSNRDLFKTVKHVYVITGSRDSGKTRVVKEIARQILKRGYVYTDLLFSRTGLKLTLNNYELNDILGILSNGIDIIGIVSAGDELDVVMSSLAILEEHFPDVIICVASDNPEKKNGSESKDDANKSKDVSSNGTNEKFVEIKNHYTTGNEDESALLKPKFIEEKKIRDFIADEKIDENKVCEFADKIINDIRGF